jgi:hypothetical protein
MARDRKSRTWIKIDCHGVLGGSINYLFLDSPYNESDIREIVSLACQDIWVKMIAFSEISGGRAGFIEDNNQKGLPYSYIAQELHCPLNLFENVLRKMEDDKAIEITKTGSIRLINFEKYQFGEYDRQKMYRENKKLMNEDSDDGLKKPYGEFENVYLSDLEYKKLSEKYGEIKTKEFIENLSSGIASKGYHYKSHYATILTWERMDKKRENKNGKQPEQAIKHQNIQVIQ